MHNTTLIKSNDEMEGIKKVKSLEDSDLLLKRVSRTVQNKAKKQKGGFLSMLMLGTSLLGNILAGKGAIVMNQGRGVNRADEGVIRAGYGNKMDFKCCLILLLILKYKNIIRMNLDLTVFILEIICLKKKSWGLCNKS